ncbi:MAG: peptidylprolyl isomerase [Candidatus Zixiibacteriota bacterium]
MKKKLLFYLLISIFVLVNVGCAGEKEKSDVKMRNDKNPVVTLSTDFGDMTFELYRDVAPVHVDSFIARTSEGFYDSLMFFRVVKNFMIQCGDPNNNGTGGKGYTLNAEFSDLPHVEGTLSMARSRSENSAGTQFFVCLARNPSTEYLDGKYTVFGQLLRGNEVLQKIGAVPVEPQPLSGENSRPKEPVHLKKTFMSDTEGNPLKK